MRFVVKSEDDKTEKLASDETYEVLKDIATNKKKAKISDKIYRDAYDTEDGKRSRVEDQLSISYKGKCAYCERICKADIEHYRPKKGVTGETHDGYYWLCYEWTNLIPACITCNREGAKHNLFPILGARVEEPSFLDDEELDLDRFKAANQPLINEVPYLLHPEVDEPEDYFEFEIDEGFKGIRIVGIDDEERGKRTIEICKLNRQELQLDRKINVIDDFTDAVRGVFAKLANGRINEDRLLMSLEDLIEGLFEKADNEDKTHTLLRKYIINSRENFEKIVFPFITIERERNILGEIFNFYVEENQVIEAVD